MNLNTDQQERFNALRDAAERFYRIRDYPAEGVAIDDYDDDENLRWKALGYDIISVWAGRLREQAEIVMTMIEASNDLKAYRPYHELQSMFRQEMAELETELQPFGLQIRPQTDGGGAALPTI